MVILDEGMEGIIGGMSVAEYAILYGAFPEVMEHIPSLNESTDALVRAGIQKLVHKEGW